MEKITLMRVRVSEELHDFLSRDRKNSLFEIGVKGRPSVGDTIESLGIPHTEVGEVRINGKKVSWTTPVRSGVVMTVRPAKRKVKGKPTFLLDVHLGKLARYLRLMGFDTLYRNDYSDRRIVALAVRGRRIVLTRDVGLLKRKRIRKGYWVRQTDPRRQVEEISKRFSLSRYLAAFSICLECNGSLNAVPKGRIVRRLEPRTRKYFDRFSRCSRCGKIYWQGSHHEKMRHFIEKMIG